MFYNPFYDLVKKLNKFNDTLAIEDKIHIHGIDVERFPYFSVYALDQIVDTLDDTGAGGEVFEQIKGLTTSEYENGTVVDFYGDNEGNVFGFGEVSAWGTLSSIISISRENKDSLELVLGDDAEIYFSILEGLEKGREWYITEKKGNLRSPIIRERFMKDEFERVYKEWPGAKYYGQFGRCHLHKNEGAKRCYDYYMNSVANRINEIDTALENKVLVIPIYYSSGKDFDKDVIYDLHLDDKFSDDGISYIIDLRYNEQNPIVGFYGELPFVIVANIEEAEPEEYNFSWNDILQEYHLNGYYGYHYFTKLRSLNTALENIGSIRFTEKLTAYTFGFDYFTMGDFGNRLSFSYFPEINNGDRFDLDGWMFNLGSYYTFGNKWVMAATGIDYGYGQFYLRETLLSTSPNLIQKEGQNVIIYKNDKVSIDPNLELRLTFPIISLNFKAGYSFDVSGKRWRLDGKMKEFTKTSFSSPYIQAGISLNYKVER